MIVYGFDSGLRSFGWAVAEFERRPGTQEIGPNFIAGGVWHTEPDKNAPRKGVDQARRTTDLWHELVALRRTFGDGAAVCVEAVAFPMGKVQYSVVSGLGRARALVDVFGAEMRARVYEALPTEVKQAVVGSRSASKEEVGEKLEMHFPEVKSLWPKLKGDREHFADACASIVACQAFAFPYLKERYLQSMEIPF